MILPSSHWVSRVQWYLSPHECMGRTATPSYKLSPTGLSPALAALSRDLRLVFYDFHDSRLLPFRSPLLRESHNRRTDDREQRTEIRCPSSVFRAPNYTAKRQLLFSFPQGTKMFQFPWFPSQRGTPLTTKPRNI